MRISASFSRWDILIRDRGGLNQDLFPGLWRCHSYFSASQNKIPGGNKLGSVTKHSQDVFARELSQAPESSPVLRVCPLPIHTGVLFLLFQD